MKVTARMEELVARADEAHGHMTAAAAELLTAISDLETYGGWPDDEASLETFLSWRYGVGMTTAHEWVRVAGALQVLPEIRAAHAAGRVSWEQLRPLTRFATPETDAFWAERAHETKLGRLYLLARRHEATQRDEAEQERRSRRLWMGWDENRTVLLIEGSLPGEQGAAFEQVVRSRAANTEVEDDVEDRMGARQADALLELVTSSGDKPLKTTVVVHTAAEVLDGSGTGLAETESGVQLSSEAARRLLCGAKVEWVLESKGRPIGMGRTSRYLSGAQLRVLRFRDRTCRFPGCEQTRWLKIHHLEHWSNGGRTDLENVILTCGRHHRALHEGGWRTSGSADGELRFHGPPGRAFTARSTAGERELVSQAG